MQHFRRALSSELLKLRRSSVLWFSALAPLLMLSFYVLIFVGQGLDAPDPRAMLTQTVNVWAGFLMPLLVILQTGLLAQTEHGQRHWQRAFAAPIPRWATYGAKWLVSVIVVAASSMVFTIAVLAIQALLGLMDSRYRFAAIGIEALTLFGAMCLATLAVLLCVSVQLWLALRVRSLVAVFSLSSVAFLVSAGFMWSKTALGLVPWVLCFSTLAHWTATGWATRPLVEPLAVGILGGLAVAAIAGWDFTRRDVV